MAGSLYDRLFGCPHKRLTRPMTPVSKPGVPSGETYVVCLDCGKQFAYDWDHMRVGEPMGRSHEKGVLHPEAPGRTGGKVKYALLGSAIPLAIVFGGALFKRRRDNEASAIASSEALEQRIALPHGVFRVRDLVEYMQRSGRDYIVLGSVDCALADHPRPHSLDYWLRDHSVTHKDTRQATDDVVRRLLATGLFARISGMRCPDTGERSEALRLGTSAASRQAGESR